MNNEPKQKKRRMRRVGDTPRIDLSHVVPEAAEKISQTVPPPNPPESVTHQDRNGRKITFNPGTGWIDIELPDGQIISGMVTGSDIRGRDGTLIRPEDLLKEGYFYATVGQRLMPMPNAIIPQFLALYKEPNGLLCRK